MAATLMRSAASGAAVSASSTRASPRLSRRVLVAKASAAPPDPWHSEEPVNSRQPTTRPPQPYRYTGSSPRERVSTNSAATATSTSSTTTSSFSGPSPRRNGNSPAPADSLLSELPPDEQRTARVYLDNAPSVVLISSTLGPQNMQNPFLPFNFPRPQGVGSGFIYDINGHVVTNAHVVGSAREVSVTLADGQVVKAKVISLVREKDIAVLKLELTPEQQAALKPVTLGSSSNLLVGQRCYAIGNPFSLDRALTQGIVSGLGRELGAGMGPLGGLPLSISDAIQTDVALNPGNSGGPLLDSNGRVVGVSCAILDPSGRGVNSGVGFAISIDSVRGLVDQIVRTGRVSRPSLGITIAPVPMTMGAFGAFGRRQQTDWRRGAAEKTEGVLVVGVQPGGPADLAGVQPTRRDYSGRLQLGDIITELDGRKVATQKDLFAALDGCRVGDTVEMQLRLHTGESRFVRVTLSDRSSLNGSE